MLVYSRTLLTISINHISGRDMWYIGVLVDIEARRCMVC